MTVALIAAGSFVAMLIGFEMLAYVAVAAVFIFFFVVVPGGIYFYCFRDLPETYARSKRLQRIMEDAPEKIDVSGSDASQSNPQSLKTKSRRRATRYWHPWARLD